MVGKSRNLRIGDSFDGKVIIIANGMENGLLSIIESLWRVKNRM